MKHIVGLLMACMFAAGMAVVANGKTNFVSSGATGAGTGADWANAYTTLSLALGNSTGGDSIWVAQGTYYAGASRTDTHALVTNVAVYGGFTTQMVTLAERDWNSYQTILDGDLDQDGTPANNAYHVVIAAAGAVLDGFTIRNGYANSSNPNERGAGIYHTNGVFTVKNCAVVGNLATNMGGGMYSGSGVNAQLQQCVFSGNIATNPSANTAAGGGIFIESSTGTVVNCTFLGNYSAFRGGAVYVNGSAQPTFDGCAFTTNWVGPVANNGGGAFYAFGTGNKPILRNCTFVGNSTAITPNAGNGGAVVIRTDGIVENCTLATNRAGLGGGISVGTGGKLTLRGCTLIGNIGKTGGGVHITGSATVSNCTFVASLGEDYGGAFFVGTGTLTADDCQVSGNIGNGTSSTPTLGAGGVAVLRLGSKGVFRNCLFSGNRGYYNGGAVSIESGSTAALTNCLFAANWAGRNTASGGAIYLIGTSAVNAVNCTFANNRASVYGGTIHCDSSTSTFVNCILWTNICGTGREAFVTNGLVTFKYTDVKGGWNGSGVVSSNGVVSDGGGNLDADPLYPPTLTGTWSATGVYDVVTGQTVLSNANAGWIPGALVARYVNPDPADADVNYKGQQQFYVVTNSATTVTVLGDASWGASGETYRIYDYHEKSGTGRWTPLGWVRDNAHSPCIDAGDPAMTVTLEPAPNRGIVNMGCFGNTLQASMSAISGSIFSVR